MDKNDFLKKIEEAFDRLKDDIGMTFEEYLKWREKNYKPLPEIDAICKNGGAKMKLIDAKTLKDDGTNYVWARFADGSFAKKEIRFVNREQIDNAPEINAIPIEWLKDFFASIEYEMIMNEEKITSDKIDDLVEYMIAEWSDQKGNWEND